jgi:Fe-S cluster biogenesis protein NfuA|tara:strand:- start:671 stop:955 length:285 start_codon:yes stop_codon:yes gene_type:complete
MVDKQMILESVGPVQAILDAHDGVVNIKDTTDGIIMISLEGGCTGCSATPMTAMQIYYSLMKLEEVEDVIFVNGELPAYMRSFIDDKLNGENKE